MIARFCSECNQESTETTWSDKFNARFCWDCYNLICEEIEAQEMSMWSEEDV